MKDDKLILMKITITKNIFLKRYFFMLSLKNKSQSTFYIVYSVKYLNLTHPDHFRKLY